MKWLITNLTQNTSEVFDDKASSGNLDVDAANKALAAAQEDAPNDIFQMQPIS